MTLMQQDPPVSSGALKARLAEVLQVAVTDDWEIYDEDPERHLALVHTTEQANLQTYGWIKGIVIDTETQCIVCQSYGNSTTVSLSMTRDLAPTVTNRYVPQPFKGPGTAWRGSTEQHSVFRFKSELGETLELLTANLQWVEGFDGTVLRVWKYRGAIYVSSHKRIHTTKNSWGGSPAFRELYDQLNGPTDALFDPALESSRHVHTFLVIHAALQVGSHVPLEKPQLLYLGEHILAGDGPLDPPAAVLNTIGRPSHLTLSEVNQRLKYGHYPIELSPYLMEDVRISHGEFVMCFEFTDEKHTAIKRCIKVQSDAYAWRSAMRANDANLEHLVFTVAGIKRRDLRRRPDFYEFTNRYPLIDLPTLEELPYLVPRLVSEQQAITQQRQIAIGALVYATHPKQQATVLKHFSTYLHALGAIRVWLLKLRSAGPDVFQTIEASHKAYGTHVVNRLRNILQVSLDRTAKAPNEEDKDKVFEDSIRYLVENEYGESLFKLYHVYKGLPA